MTEPISDPEPYRRSVASWPTEAPSADEWLRYVATNALAANGAGFGFRARCLACGWAGPDRDSDYDDAVADSADHSCQTRDRGKVAVA